MANYDKEVYYSQINYEQKMNDTKELFIKGKYDNVNQKEFSDQVQEIWTIDHSYMERTIQEQTEKIRDDDHVTMKQQQDLPIRYELNSVDTFKFYENKYANKITNSYNRITENNVDFLTKIIKDFVKLEWVKIYSNGAKHSVADYLSMLYNVNLRMASWNQTIKDGEILGIDLVRLEYHPNACEDCLQHMGKIYSINGTTKGYDTIDKAYNEGVGHPNCKCNFTLVWNDTEIKVPQIDYYEQIQKGRALQRDIEKLKVDSELYRYIGNGEQADKTQSKINKLQIMLFELMSENTPIIPYLNELSNLYVSY